MEKEVDVNNLIEEFLHMNSLIEDLTIEYETLKNDRKITDKRLCMFSIEEKELQKEKKSLQHLITSYQSMLSDYEATQEEKHRLKNSISELKNGNSKLEKEKEELKKIYAVQAQDTQNKHKKELETLKLKLQEEAQEERNRFESRLDIAAKDVQRLTKMLSDKEKQQEIELNRLQLEHETKLQKLQQRQAAQINSSSNSLIAKNDIFRKKLQHLQVESDKEIKALNSRCTEQQQKIAEQQHQIKLHNKQLNEQRKQHEEQVRQVEKLNRQAQLEIRNLQNHLKQEKDRVFSLEKSLRENELPVKERSAAVVPPKKRKTMFNPQQNRLNSLL